jgi:hypothetical protein
MARAGRLAGAILAESGEQYFLVGLTKEPCDFDKAGFATPEALPSASPWFVPLERRNEGPVALPPPTLELPVEGETLARVLSQRFVIERNGSVSERLWRLVLIGGDRESEDEVPESVDARWLGEMPPPFWQIIRDTVLRCS